MVHLDSNIHVCLALEIMYKPVESYQIKDLENRHSEELVYHRRAVSSQYSQQMESLEPLNLETHISSDSLTIGSISRL